MRMQDAVEVIAWASVIVVVSMFLVDGGIKAITDVGSAFGSLSRLTALVGTDLLLIHMLLVARVPWIDRLYGLDIATAKHKKLGKPVLYLVVAHFIASLINYAMLDGKTLWDEFLNMLFNVNDPFARLDDCCGCHLAAGSTQKTQLRSLVDHPPALLPFGIPSHSAPDFYR